MLTASGSQKDPNTKIRNRFTYDLLAKNSFFKSGFRGRTEPPSSPRKTATPWPVHESKYSTKLSRSKPFFDYDSGAVIRHVLEANFGERPKFVAALAHKPHSLVWES